MHLRDWIIITIAVYIGFGIGTAVTINSFSREIARQKAIDGGIIVEATIYGAGSLTGHKPTDRTSYGLYYRYENEETGIVYEGTIVTSIVNYDEAQSHKGEIVRIYISNEVDAGGNGINIPVGKSTSAYTNLTVAIVFAVILLGYTTLIIIMIVRHYRRKKEKNMITDKPLEKDETEKA